MPPNMQDPREEERALATVGPEGPIFVKRPAREEEGRSASTHVPREEEGDERAVPVTDVRRLSRKM